MDIQKSKRRIGVAELASKLNVHLMTIPRLVREGRLPPPDKLLNKNMWWEHIIDDLIEHGLPPKSKARSR